MVERRDLPPVATFFAADEPLVAGAMMTLGNEVAHHARVRRLGLGDAIRLVDGRGFDAEAVIVRIGRDALAAQIGTVGETSPLRGVHLLVPIADRDRMLWLAEKCTELGVTSWRPVLWRRSKSVKPRGDGPTFAARIRTRMIQALEQSGGSWLPTIFPESSPERAISGVPDGARLLLRHGAPPMLSMTAIAPVTLAVGPEGGLEEEECAMLVASGFRAVSLAGNLMRFETAAIAGVAIARAALAAHVGESDGH